MSLLASRIVRSKINVRSRFAATALIDVATNSTIESVRGNATIFQFGFFDHLSAVYDLSEVESLTLKIQPSQTPGGSTLVSQTLAAAALDLTLDATTWGNETKQHAVFSFTNAQMNFTIGATRKSFWLVITAILTDGKEVTLAGGDFILHEDNNATAGVPDENPGTAITLEQADARYPRAIARTEAQGPPENAVLALGGLEFQPSTANPDIGSTVTIGLVTYEFVASASTAGEVSLGATTFDTATNLLDEINGDGLLPANSLVRGLDVGSGPTVNMESKFDGYTDEDIPLLVSDDLYWNNIGLFAVTSGDVADGLGQKCYVGDAPGPFRIFEAVHKHPTIWQETTAGHLINTTTGDTQKLVVSGAADSEIITITDLP